MLPRRKRMRWSAFLLFFLLGAGALVFFAPRLLSTSAARRAVLVGINNRIAGTAHVDSWFFSWTRGIRFDGVFFTPGKTGLSVEAEGITISFTIPDMVRAAYALRFAKQGELLNAPLKGGINIFRGRIRKDDELLLQDLNALSKIDSLADPFSIIISARSGPADGTLDIAGDIHLLPGGIFDLDTIKCNLSLKISKWNAAATTRAISGTKDDFPDVALMLSGALRASMNGINTLDTSGALALWPSIPTKDRSEFANLDSIDIEIAAARLGENLTLSRLTIESDAFTASASGAGALTASNTISSATLQFKVGSEVTRTIRLIAVLLPHPFASMSFTNENSKFKLDGDISVDMRGKTNLLDAITLSINSDVQSLEIEPILAITETPSSVPALAGIIGGRVSAAMKGKSSLRAKGMIELRDIIAEGGFLGADTPSLDNLKLDFDVQRNGDEIQIGSCSLRSPILDADVSGIATVANDMAVPDINIAITGKLHAAEAARALPGMMKMSPVFSFSGGALTLDAVLASSNNMLSFDATLAADGLRALRNGHETAFPQPLIFSASGTAVKHILELQSFELTSQHLTLNGSLDAETAHVDATADLAGVLKETSKFMDIGEKTASGQLTLSAKASLLGPRAARITMKTALANSSLIGFTPAPLALESFGFDINAEATLDEDMRLLQVKTLSVISVSDLGSIGIEGSDISTGTDKKPSAKAAGLKLESSFLRVLPLIHAFGKSTEDMALAGNIAASASCSLMNSILKMPKMDINLAPFTFRHGTKLSIEKSLRLAGRLSATIEGTPYEQLAGTDAEFLLSIGSANLMGMRLTDIKLPFRLQGGCAAIDIETTINEGKLLLPLRVDIAHQPMIAEIPDHTRILQGVRLTDEMVNEMLVFISPLLRGCAVSSGSVGAQMNRFRFPFGTLDPALTEFDCITSFKGLSFGASGLLFDILSLANLQQEKITIPDQNVSSKHRNGRIFTEPLTLKASGFDVIISGSAGLDGTLDYVVQLPFTPGMVGETAYRYLQGQSIVLPVSGTVKQPAFDKSRFVEEATRTAAAVGMEKLREKAGDEGGKLIEKGMKEGEKLLKKWLGQ